MAKQTTEEHECVFAEEQEPSGRLILGPCLVCNLPALEALQDAKDSLAIADKTIDNIRFLAENDQLDGIKGIFREPPYLKEVQ